MDDLVPKLVFCGELYSPSSLVHSHVFFLIGPQNVVFTCLSQVDFVICCFSFTFKLEMDFDNSSSIVIATLLIQVSKGWYYTLGTLIFDI